MDRPQHDTTGRDESSAARERPTKGAWRIIAVLLVLATVLGVLMFRNLMESERYLAQSWHEIGELGTGMSVDGCVDAVLNWSQRCEAMKGLCDLSVTGMMARCLEGQDRRAYCSDVGIRMYDTRYGVAECTRRELESRHERSVCAASYRAVDGHCRVVTRDETL